MNEEAHKSFWEKELEYGMGAFVVAPLVLLVTPSILVPLLPGRLTLVLVLSLVVAAASYVGFSRRQWFRLSRDPLEFGGWKALILWLVLTSLLTELVNLAWR